MGGVITIVWMNLKPKNIQEISSIQMYISIYIMCKWHFYQPVFLMQKSRRFNYSKNSVKMNPNKAGIFAYNVLGKVKKNVQICL